MLGYRYRLGARGENREIDCIGMTFHVLQGLGIPTPEYREEWYHWDLRRILCDIEAWGRRIRRLRADGDVLLFHDKMISFAVVVEGGLLHIDQVSERVAWAPLRATRGRCYRWWGIP